MKRKARLRRYGIAASVIVAVAFISSPKRTPFEEGYGLRPIGETVEWEGTTRLVIRDFGSTEDFDAVAARLDRTIPRQRVRTASVRVWTPPEGAVTTSAEPIGLLNFRIVPKGTRTFMETTSAPPLTILQKLALVFGKRI